MRCCSCKSDLPETDFTPSQQAAPAHRCKNCFREKQNRYYVENKDYVKMHVKAYAKANPEKIKARYQQLRDKVFTAYGGYFCVCCGETEPTFLTLDHIDGGGRKHRDELGNKGRGTNFYQWLLENNFPEGLRVLCYNCNCGRSRNGGVCAHERKQAMHSFDHDRPEHRVMPMHIPAGHAHLDEKHQKGMRAPIASQLPMDPGIASQELEGGQARSDGSLGPQGSVESGVAGSTQGY